MRFEGDVQLQAGSYEFAIQSDDGIRLRLDGEQLYEDWTVHAAPAQPVKVTKRVAAGTHHVLVEYFEKSDRAVVRVGWKRVGP